MTDTINRTDLQQLNHDVATLVFGVKVCDKPMESDEPCSLNTGGEPIPHLAADEPAPNYLGLDDDDDWPGDWDGMRDIVRAMDAKGYTCAMYYGGSKGNEPEAQFWLTGSDMIANPGERAEAPTLPEAVARAAVAAMKAAKEPQP